MATKKARLVMSLAFLVGGRKVNCTSRVQPRSGAPPVRHLGGWFRAVVGFNPGADTAGSGYSSTCRDTTAGTGQF
jgi:hypothetical protein